MSLIPNIFSWTSKRRDNPTKQARRTPNSIDWTDEYQCNHALTYGLYHNQFTGMKLAGALAFNPIAVPVWFMGLPIPESDSETDKAMLDEVTEQFSTFMGQIHVACHRDGTVWIWPFFSATDGQLHWEMIPDPSVVAIVRSVETGNVIKIICEEELTVTVDDLHNVVTTRRREFTRETVTEKWTGQKLPENITSGTKRNMSGELPIPFSNNAEANRTRGHSDYERIIYDLKDYHDIDLMQSTTLAKFNTKLVMTVKDVGQYLANNGYTNIDEINVATSDLFMNVPDEKSELLFPTNAHEAYESALKRKFRKIVEGSGIPEICWGIKVEGNLASAEEQMGLLIQFVKDKRTQKTKPYQRLFAASLRLLGVVRMQAVSSDIVIKWGALDELSAKTKAEVFQLFAQGVAALISSAGVTKEQLYRLWDSLYPDATQETVKEFVTGISAMGKHKQWKDASYVETMDAEFNDGMSDDES